MAAAEIGYGALAAFQIYSGYLQAENIARQARLSNKINQLNARYAEIEAEEAVKFGYTQSAAYQKTIDSTIAQQRVGYAAQGVDVSSGTAAEVQAESRLTGMFNILDIQAEARKRAMGLKNEAGNLRLGAGIRTAHAAAQAQASMTAGIAGAAETGISYYSRYGKSGGEEKLTHNDTISDYAGNYGYDSRRPSNSWPGTEIA